PSRVPSPAASSSPSAARPPSPSATTLAPSPSTPPCPTLTSKPPETPSAKRSCAASAPGAHQHPARRRNHAISHDRRHQHLRLGRGLRCLDRRHHLVGYQGPPGRHRPPPPGL